MLKKNILNSLKLINYYKFINYNLIYNNKAINRYKADNFELPEDKAKKLELLKNSIINLKNCELKKNAKNIVFSDGNPKSKIMLIPFILKHIEIIQPKILVLLGSTAMNALIGKDVVISKIRGKWIEKDFGSCKTSVIITFHPAFLMRQPAQKKMSWIDLKMIRDKKTNLKI